MLFMNFDRITPLILTIGIYDFGFIFLEDDTLRQRNLHFMTTSYNVISDKNPLH